MTHFPKSSQTACPVILNYLRRSIAGRFTCRSIGRFIRLGWQIHS